MILRLRSKMQQPWFKTVVWASLSALMLLSLAPELIRRLGAGSGPFVVRVGRTTVDQQEFSTAIQKKLLLLRLRMGPYADMILQQLTPRILGEMVVQDVLLSKIADKLGISVEEEYAKTRMPQDIPASSQHLIQEVIRQEIAHELVISCADANLIVPSWTVSNELNRQYAKRRCLVASLSRSTVEAELKAKGIDEKALEQFFVRKNKERKAYWTPQRRSALIYEFVPSTYGVTVSDKELEALYNKVKYQRFVATPAQMQLQQIVLIGDMPGANIRYAEAVQLALQLQKAPETFAAVAQEKSGGPVDIGFVSKDKLSPTVAEAAFALAHDGEVSGVIRAEDNKYIIVKRLAKKSAVYKPLTAVQETLKKELIEQKFSKQFANDAKRATLGSTKKELLAMFAEKHHGAKSALTAVTNDNSPLHQQIFAGRKDAVGATVISGKGYAFVVTEVQNSAQPSFESVKSRVLQDYLQETALQQIEKRLQALADKENIAQAARAADLTVTTTPLLAPQDKEGLEELRKKLGSAADKCAAMNVIGQTALVMMADGGYLIQATDIVAPSSQAIEEHKATLAAQLFQEEKRLAEGVFIEKLAKDVKIKYNNDLIS